LCVGDVYRLSTVRMFLYFNAQFLQALSEGFLPPPPAPPAQLRAVAPPPALAGPPFFKISLSPLSPWLSRLCCFLAPIFTIALSNPPRLLHCFYWGESNRGPPLSYCCFSFHLLGVFCASSPTVDGVAFVLFLQRCVFFPMPSSLFGSPAPLRRIPFFTSSVCAYLVNPPFLLLNQILGKASPSPDFYSVWFLFSLGSFFPVLLFSSVFAPSPAPPSSASLCLPFHATHHLLPSPPVPLNHHPFW